MENKDNSQGKFDFGDSGEPEQNERLWFVAESMPTGRAERRAESGSGQVAGIGESVRRVEDTKPHGRRGRSDGDTTGNGGEVQAEGRGPTNGFWADAEWLPCRDGKHRPTGRGIHPLVMGNTTRTGQLRTPEHENYDENSGVRRGYDYCNTGENHDTKAGRPVEPGTLPLVNGTPANMVRVCDTGEEVDADNSPEARVMRLKGYGNCICAPVAAAWIRAYMEVGE